MTNEELYQLMKDGFDQINQRLDRMDDRLNEMDTQLHAVENGISELKGRQSGVAGVRNWIGTAGANGALILCIVVAIFK